ncbi:MAG TPA: 4a-hydroxytetrahydrobiopterin dehydratase [Aeromicrobium sp.]|nr:4a-hydroxytetrahydrobiopterin dehydratase [Aeromicrobium sp.]
MSGLSTDEMAQKLTDFTGWAYDGEALIKTFEFDGFAAAIDFMSAARPRIDELNHHPEWTNVYNRVDVRLNSHDVGGVTERDFRLARLLDEVAGA